MTIRALDRPDPADTLAGVTTEGVAPDSGATEDDFAALRCYRHPDRETRVRCGRCDQPICSRCAMQGPVGFRCRQCGRPVRDPLTSMRPSQLAIGLAIAVAGGLVVGIFSTRIGFFGLIIAWFAGGIIADAILRFVGIKRGPLMAATLVGGILAGAAVGFGTSALTIGDTFGPGGGSFLAAYLREQAFTVVLAAGIACFGAWSRLQL
jgi:hypothetical protein